MVEAFAEPYERARGSQLRFLVKKETSRGDEMRTVVCNVRKKAGIGAGKKNVIEILEQKKGMVREKG